MIDVNSGKVQNVIPSFGGFLNIGDKLFRYPLSAFTRSDLGDLILNVDEQKLKTSQGFDRNDWPEGRNGTENGAASNGNSSLSRASRLIGRDVADRRGEHLGEIKDLVIDMRNAKVDNAVLQYDRRWSLDNPLVAMPLRSFNFGNGHQDVSLNVDKSQIDAQVANNSAIGSPYGNVVLERWIVLVPDTATASTASNTTGSTNSSSPSSKTGSSTNTAGQTATTSSSANKGYDANSTSSRRTKLRWLNRPGQPWNSTRWIPTTMVN